MGLTLSDCADYFDAGDQVPFNSITVHYVASYTNDDAGFTLDETLTLTRVPYSPGGILGEFEFWCYRSACWPFPVLEGGQGGRSWDKFVDGGLHAFDNSDPENPCEEDIDVFIYFGINYLSSDPTSQATFNANFIRSGDYMCGGIDDSVYYALTTTTDPFDLNHVTLAELGENMSMSEDTPCPGFICGGSATYTFN